MVQRSNSGRPAFYRGEEGRRRADEELVKDKQKQAARKEAQNMPFRFRIAPDSSTQFIVVDDAPDFFRFEHNMKNPATGFWDTFTGCVAEWDNCPVCEAAGKDPYYAMYLTVIDLTPFSTKDGTKHEFSRKLLVVKPAQQKKFHRLYNKFAAEGLTLRGALFEATRDSDKDSSIGNELEYIEHVSEEEMQDYVREWTDRDKKRHTENCSEAYDYEKLFEAPDTEKLRAIVGGRPTPGSRQHDREAMEEPAPSRTSRSRRTPSDDNDGDDWQEPSTNERMSRSRVAGGRGGRDSDDEVDTSRTSSRTRVSRMEEAQPSSVPGAGRRARVRHEDDADGPPFDSDEEQENARPRSSRRLAR